MSIFKKFNNDDLFNVQITTSPHIQIKSGSEGFTSNVGVSSSISIFEAPRSSDSPLRGKIQYSTFVDTYTIDGFIEVKKSYPITQSLKISKINKNDSTSGYNDKHFSVIENLYSYYKLFDVDYDLSTYDYNSLYFRDNSNNRVSIYNSSAFDTITASILFETWINPIRNQGVDRYIVDKQDHFSLYITPNNLLNFSSSNGIVTSSFEIQHNKWQYVAISWNSGSSGSFWFDGQPRDLFNFTSQFNTSLYDLVIGSKSGSTDLAFDGFIHETRLWDSSRTNIEINKDYNKTLINTASFDNLKCYLRYTEGALYSSSFTGIGSGVFDYSNKQNNGRLIDFNDRFGPIWHPNDNVLFTTLKNKSSGTIENVKVIDIPRNFYEKNIRSGSVSLLDNSYYELGMVRNIVDDGRGNLYISGSILSASLTTGSV